MSRKNCRSYEEHDFYCINCGQKGIPLARGNNNPRSKFHRKYMYCLHCQCMMNHVECRNQDEVKTFFSAYNKGEFANEVMEEKKYAAEHPGLHAYL